MNRLKEHLNSNSEDLDLSEFLWLCVIAKYFSCFDSKARDRLDPKQVHSIRRQRAMVLLIDGIYEQKFLSLSYGFRPKRKAVDCVARVAKQVYSHRHVLEADIEKFFDRVSHKRLKFSGARPFFAKRRAPRGSR